MKKNENIHVILKNYSKIIFFYPLLVYSIIAYIIQKVSATSQTAIALIWMFLFFINIVVIGFDFSSLKFLILFLMIMILGLVLILTGTLDTLLSSIRDYFDYTLENKFYGWMIFNFSFAIFFAVIQAQFHYVKIEKNEVYIKGLTEGKSDRYPNTHLKIKTQISDVFELICLGAGSVSMELDGEIIKLDTIPFVNKKKRIIDELLSTTLVKTSEK